MHGLKTIDLKNFAKDSMRKNGACVLAAFLISLVLGLDDLSQLEDFEMYSRRNYGYCELDDFADCHICRKRVHCWLVGFLWKTENIRRRYPKCSMDFKVGITPMQYGLCSLGT